ncbi:MAG TPA: SDR family oxidoreductase [Chitinophagaceae bacterium]|nr:SDR family oxidoreductase [Chitinophagaceae bacterium]
MQRSKKNILIFGANSYLAKNFIEKYNENYTLHPVYRNHPGELNIDFAAANDHKAFAEKINYTIDAIIFFQGINPSMGIAEITEEHFIKMMKLNLITPTLLLQSLKEKLTNGAVTIFFSSVAKRKGSYDPSYAAAKSGLTGLMHSLANAYKMQRFNIISLGLVESSPVFNQMSDEFRKGHAARMQNGNFIKAENVTKVIDMIITNDNLNRADISLDGGFS